MGALAAPAAGCCAGSIEQSEEIQYDRQEATGYFITGTDTDCVKRLSHRD